MESMEKNKIYLDTTNGNLYKLNTILIDSIDTKNKISLVGTIWDYGYTDTPHDRY
jgi:hypothetical protein